MTSSSKRDVVFLVADSGMEQMLRGFFGRENFHRSLGCGPFAFDPREDVFVAPTKDPGVYGTARELLRPFERLHQRAVVMLDAAWDGCPGKHTAETAELIRTRITDALTGVWEHFEVIVIEPELEAWVWQDNPNVATALKCPPDFRAILAASGHWPADQPKPPDPKAALEYLCRHHRADGSKAAFRRLAEIVSVRHCRDTSFNRLRATLRAWFPETY